MNQIPKTADVVIIGGGVMGASIAYHLALCGIKDIIVLEKDSFYGNGATGRCAGGIRYQFATEVNIQLSIKSLPMLEQFADEIGQEIDYQQCGYMFLLTESKDIEKFELNIALQNNLGINSELIDGDVVRRMLPDMVLNDVLMGSFNADDGLADPNGVVMGYINAAQKQNVNTITDAEVVEIDIKQGKISGVQTKNARISSPIVVNAAGPWAGEIGKLAGIEIPITPVRRQMLTTSPLLELPEDFPFVIDFSRSLYFHREGEGILTGMSNPDQASGFDQSIDQEWEISHMEAAIQRMPMLENASMLSHWAGLYEVTPDAHPIYGKTDVEGFYLCAGFSGHGFMHGPISGKLMAEVIQDDAFRSVDVSMLDLDRFKENRMILEYNVV